MVELLTPEEVRETLKTVYDPEIPINVVDLGLVYDIQVNDNNNVYVQMCYEEARLVEQRRDSNHDAAPDQWSLYGEDGELVETRRDTDGDGLVDVWSMNAADGRLQRAVYDTDGDGRADRWIDYRVDGSIASIETDSDGDGTPDQRVVPKRR